MARTIQQWGFTITSQMFFTRFLLRKMEHLKCISAYGRLKSDSKPPKAALPNRIRSQATAPRPPLDPIYTYLFNPIPYHNISQYLKISYQNIQDLSLNLIFSASNNSFLLLKQEETKIYPIKYEDKNLSFREVSALFFMVFGVFSNLYLVKQFENDASHNLGHRFTQKMEQFTLNLIKFIKLKLQSAFHSGQDSMENSEMRPTNKKGQLQQNRLTDIVDSKMEKHYKILLDEFSLLMEAELKIRRNCQENNLNMIVIAKKEHSEENQYSDQFRGSQYTKSHFF